MGQTISCACFEHMSLLEDGGSEKASNERLQILKTGNKFKRSAYLGLTSQDLIINLSDDTSAIQWKTENTWTKAEHGEIDLTSQVKSVKLFGDNGFQFIALDDTVIFDLKAEESSVRDQWVLALNELLHSWIDHPETKPKSSISVDGTSNKAEYFKRREAEIKAREKANAERKTKYSAGGMKYTAEAMANRS
jgi:hypothetical protein